MDVLDYGIHYGQGYLFGKPGLQGAYKPKKVA
jgi:EAL domain-containing protein (putative c-di-GMP-specific phosphodiesterase class I)